MLAFYLYVKGPIAAYADGGAQEYGLRAGTENVAEIVSSAVALKKILMLLRGIVSMFSI